jgi:hypothetical protein
MGAWGAGNFQDDTALDWLSLSIQKPLVEDIESMLGSHDEGSGPAIIAAVEVLAVFCEAVPAVPPEPEVVTAWHYSYVEGWESYIDDLEPGPEYKAQKLQIINATFQRLLAVARKWHTEESDAAATADGPGD